jgi:uncharacterized membrane protein YiaA
MRIIFVLCVFVSLFGCDIADKSMDDKNNQLIDVLIMGSAESPDPVLKRVIELEKSGVVKEVVVLESFPVQIHLKATKEIIDELNSIPRVESQH